MEIKLGKLVVMNFTFIQIHAKNILFFQYFDQLSGTMHWYIEEFIKNPIKYYHSTYINNLDLGG